MSLTRVRGYLPLHAATGRSYRRSLRDAWLAAHEEWGPGLLEDGFGLGPDDDTLDGQTWPELT
jgi:hypothetical protein